MAENEFRMPHCHRAYVDLNKATTMKSLSAFPAVSEKKRDFFTVWRCGCRICSISIEQNSVEQNVDSKNYGNDGFSMKYFMNSNREYSQRSRDALQLTYLSLEQAFSELITWVSVSFRWALIWLDSRNSRERQLIKKTDFTDKVSNLIGFVCLLW